MIDKGLVMSVKERLKNVARINNRAFDNVLQMYLLERLLFRLSRSQYSDNFVLKGGMLLFALYDNLARPTRDMDFSANHISNDIGDIGDIFKNICSIECADVVEYDASSISCNIIQNDDEYRGVRVLVTGSLGKAVCKVQIDIGFGDAQYNPVMLDYPALLDDSPRARIWASSVETVIAEKFSAMLDHALLNSRMKDFYDVYILATTRDFVGANLFQAIRLTNETRATERDNSAVVFAADFYNSPERVEMWTAFLKRARLGDVNFFDIGKTIIDFLEPVYTQLLNGSTFAGNWDCKLAKWISD